MAHTQPAETETVKIFMYIFMGCEMENDTPGNKYPKTKKVSNKASKPLRSHVTPALFLLERQEKNCLIYSWVMQDLHRRCCSRVGDSDRYDSTFHCISYTS